MNKENLTAYALNFVSFLLDSDIAKDIKQVILFGSIARGDFDRESDIDLFIDTNENNEEKINNLLSLFKRSEAQRRWELKGLKHEISLKIGNLDEWKLKRSIISDGILLYGKFKDIPEEMEHFMLFSLSFGRIKKSKQVKLWRKLYGYKQKVGRKLYRTMGLIERLNGRRFESTLIIPIRNKKEILDFLKKEKIGYVMHELWSDSL